MDLISVSGVRTRTRHVVTMDVDTPDTFRTSWSGSLTYAIERVTAAWTYDEGGWSLVSVGVGGANVKKNGQKGERQRTREMVQHDTGSLDPSAPDWLRDLISRATPSGTVREGEVTS